MKQFVCFFLLVGISISAQIKSVVKDSLTGKPIPYVGIWTNSETKSFSSDKKGKFEIPKENTIEELLFFTSKYQAKKITIHQLKESIYLTPISEEKAANKPIQKTEKIILNEFKFSKNYTAIAFDEQTTLLAKYIPYNESYSQTKFLKNIQIGLVSCLQNSVCKIRFFEADSEGNPSNEIANSEVISKIYMQDETSKTETNSKINLIKKQIEFSKNGLFVALEIMFLDENYTCLPFDNSKEHCFLNPKIISFEKSGEKTWAYINGKWIKNDDDSNFAVNLTLTN